MFEFRLPDVGEGVAEGEVVEWHVEPGDEVEEDDVLAEIETDKAVVDLPSPVTGTVAERHAAVGDVVPVGDVIVTIEPTDEADSNAEAAASEGADTGDPGEAPEAGDSGPKSAIVDRSSDERAGEGADETASTDTAGGRIFAPPHVRRLARELGVEVRAVTGSGSGRRVTAADVREAAGAGGADDEDVADAITEVAPEAAVSSVEESEPSTGPERTSAIRRVGDSDGGTDRSDGAAKGQAGTAAEPEAAGRTRTLAAPATRRLADELGVDLDDVPTDETRDGEPFVEPDAVEAFVRAREAAQVGDATAEAESVSERAGDAGTTGGRADGERATSDHAAGESETREPYRGVRRTIGRQMEQSAFTAPHVTHHDRAVATGLVEAREALRSRAEERGISLTYVPFVLKAVVAGLKEYPVLNSSLDEEAAEVVYKHYYDLGVATATDAGLMVPVVRRVDEKGLLQLASEVDEVVSKARDRSIDREEMRGGTFTITNFGAIGGEYATPIINYPETAILGLGSIERRPVVVDGAVEARHTLPLSLSIDHRVIDGAEAARFVNTVVEYLENPSLLLLD